MDCSGSKALGHNQNSGAVPGSKSGWEHAFAVEARKGDGETWFLFIFLLAGGFVATSVCQTILFILPLVSGIATTSLPTKTLPTHYFSFIFPLSGGAVTTWLSSKTFSKHCFSFIFLLSGGVLTTRLSSRTLLKHGFSSIFLLSGGVVTTALPSKTLPTHYFSFIFPLIGRL